MDCRIVGCIEGDQSQGTTKYRSDRFLAVPEQSSVFENVISIEDIPSTLLTEIESFFINYMHGEGKELNLLENLNASQAISLLSKIAGTAEIFSITV